MAVAEADLTDPASVLAHRGVRAVINPAEPVCLVFGLVLSLMPARQAREVVAAYADRAAPGSCVVISCGRVDDEGLWAKLREAYTAADCYNHAPAEVGTRPPGAHRGAELARRLAWACIPHVRSEYGRP